MQKRKRVFWLLCMMILLLVAMPATAQAKAKYKLSGVTKPTSINKGGVFSIRGTILCNKPMKEIRVTIYNATRTTCLQRYVAKPNSTSFNIAQADPYILFDKLSPGNYYYAVKVKSVGAAKTVICQKFTVTGRGQIKIVNPKPSADFSIDQGKTYSIGGTVTSTYNIAGLRAMIINSSGKSVYVKTVKPNTTSYKLDNSELDAAMLFNKLGAGTYTYRVIAVDNQGTKATLVNRKLTVNGNAVTPGSTGNDAVTQPSDYLNTSQTVPTPAGYAARTTRPAANNNFYYNANYNIYYKYNSLAPTGAPYYGEVYVLGNCTWYACGRAMEIVARAGGNISNVQAIFGGDPVGIYYANMAKGKFKYGKEPKVGALAIFNYGVTGDAHIAVVEKVVNGVPYVSESGYSEGATKPDEDKSNIVFKYQSIYNWAGGRNLLGYIYLI